MPSGEVSFVKVFVESVLGLGEEFFLMFLQCRSVSDVEGLEKCVLVVVVFLSEKHSLQCFVVSMIPFGSRGFLFYAFKLPSGLRELALVNELKEPGDLDLRHCCQWLTLSFCYRLLRLLRCH